MACCYRGKKDNYVIHYWIFGLAMIGFREFSIIVGQCVLTESLPIDVIVASPEKSFAFLSN